MRNLSGRWAALKWSGESIVGLVLVILVLLAVQLWWGYAVGVPGPVHSRHPFTSQRHSVLVVSRHDEPVWFWSSIAVQVVVACLFFGLFQIQPSWRSYQPVPPSNVENSARP